MLRCTRALQLFLLLAAALSTNALLPAGTSAQTQSMGSRRTLLQRSVLAFSLPAVLSPAVVHALEDLEDLSAPAPLAAKPIEPSNAVAVSVVTKDASAKKDTPYSRIKELQAKGNNLTDKEKKELRRLKAEEMCEMLGRGC